MHHHSGSRRQKKAEKHLNAPAVRNLTAKKRWPKILEDKDNRAFLKKKTPKEKLAAKKLVVRQITAPSNQKGKQY